MEEVCWRHSDRAITKQFAKTAATRRDMAYIADGGTFEMGSN